MSIAWAPAGIRKYPLRYTAILAGANGRALEVIDTPDGTLVILSPDRIYGGMDVLLAATIEMDLCASWLNCGVVALRPDGQLIEGVHFGMVPLP